MAIKLDASDAANMWYWAKEFGLSKEQVLISALHYAAAWAEGAAVEYPLGQVQSRIAYGPWHVGAQVRYVGGRKAAVLEEVSLLLTTSEVQGLTKHWRQFVDPRPKAARPRDQVIRCVATVLIYFGLRELHAEDSEKAREFFKVADA